VVLAGLLRVGDRRYGLDERPVALLGLPHPFLGLRALGDILDGSNQACRTPTLVTHHPVLGVYGAHFAIGTDDTVVYAAAFPIVECPPDTIANAHLVIGMDGLEKRAVVGNEAMRLETEYAVEFCGPVRLIPIKVVPPIAYVGYALSLGESCLAV
jgi:hypothetical protein